mgnify:CR=1 FL=1
MKVSVFNICSEALDMLKFSTEMAIKNAGNELDYIMILWNPSQEVEDFIDGLKRQMFYLEDSGIVQHAH